ncbi:hypothetical protein QWY75_02570 [Pontixanthobacter aestiaquae]|uniref:Uncharacterized protein n=1 Tax=Pontixanthobacter aestiaquae TaxID=1509367 RepID=A0A844Z9C2_9SPHN|nr:hypothetical protein [Pontixanthobacter aestiaquae]MDN3645088.1 hypothetical protein [Pontixanthobacter aestiaquae]MXO83912.1 hypothetical protein [Pontixanthobacter aestiaquae]
MSREKQIEISWSAVLWILAGLFLIVGMLSFRQLDKSVRDLEEKRESLESQVAALSYERDQMVSSQILLLANSGALADQLEVQMPLLENGCIPDYRIRCGFWKELTSLYLKLRDTIEGRITAASLDDFEELESEYNEVLSLSESIAWRGEGEKDRWRGIALEGIAYARLRQENDDAALSMIEEAEALYPNSGIINSTSLKIRCANGASPTEISRKYRQFVEGLAVDVESQTASSKVSSANFNRNLFLSDPEIEQYCGAIDSK